MTAPRLRLALDRAFWIAAAVAFALRERQLWHWVGRVVAAEDRRAEFFWHETPDQVSVALLIAAGATVAAMLVVDHVVGPLVRAWYRPPVGPRDLELPYQFALEAGERVAAGWPARMRVGGLWRSGCLIVTDRRIALFPKAWNVEPWSLPIERLGSAWVGPEPVLALGLVRGLPGALRLEDGSGTAATLAVADPAEVLRALGRPAAVG